MEGFVTSIYSSKGGVGKSLIAANLAVDLALETKENVLIIDFGQPFSSDIARILNLNGVKRISGLLPTADSISPSILKSYATRHETGISCLSLTDGEPVATADKGVMDRIVLLLAKLQGIYPHIVIDFGMKYHPGIDALLDRCGMIFIPFLPEMLSLQQAKNDLQLFRQLNYPRSKIRLVANMSDKTGGFNYEQVQQIFQKEIAAFIPYDASVQANLNQGPYPSAMPRHKMTKAFDQMTLQVLEFMAKHPQSRVAAGGRHNRGDSSAEVASPDFNALKRRIHHKLLETIDLKQIQFQENNPEKLSEIKRDISKSITEIIDSETDIQSREVRNELLRQVMQETLGLGPLEDLLADDSITEIMVNRWDQIYVERGGKMVRIDKQFMSEKHLVNIIGRIAAPLGRKIDISTPMLDARLPDGSRVNAIIPPLAINGAAVTIRKFPNDPLGIQDLVKIGTLSKQIAEFLKAAVQGELNVVVSGGTGTGKTTLLNVLSSFIPHSDRIVTIEDSAELKLQQPHVITLESRPPNIEGKGEITIRDLVKNALRMRPDRIVVGECRGAEALDMLQAMNTGHDGSLTTLHANSAREAFSRLETLVMFAGFELPQRAIKEQIAGAIDLVVQISRFKDGSRKLVQVSEVTGIQSEAITMGDIFVYKQTGEKAGRVSGHFVATGYVPKCLEDLQEKGLQVPREMFWSSA